MCDLLPAVLSSAEPGSGNDNNCDAGAARQPQQRPSSSGPSSWLSGLRDIIPSSGSADIAGSGRGRGNSDKDAAVAAPFASMSRHRKRKQQQQGQEQQLQVKAEHAENAAAATVADDATQVVNVRAGDEADQAAAAAAAQRSTNSESDTDDDDSEFEWEPEEDDNGNLLGSFTAMLERSWFGTDSSSQQHQQRQQQRKELKSFPLPPPSPFQFSSTRTRQLTRHRAEQQQSSKHASSAAAELPAKPSAAATHSSNNSVNDTPDDGDADEDSWLPSSWLPRAVQRALGRTASSRVPGLPAKPLRVKMAERVLGEDLVDALELVQRDILESEDPLPEATIKFFVRAGLGVATGWAHKNINRVFLALGGYVAATCGAMHATKQAAKWVAWKLPMGAGQKVGPAVAFTADVLLPTQFFGPFAATYLVVRVVVKDHRRMLAAAAAVQAAEELGADGKTMAHSAISAALDAESEHDDAEARVHDAEARADDLQQQQQKQKQQQQRPLRMRTLQRSNRIAAGASCRSRARGAVTGRTRRAVSSAGS